MTNKKDKDKRSILEDLGFSSDDIMGMLGGYQKEQRENLERYRILFGEEKAREMEEKLADPHVSLSIHIAPPYDTMPLDKLRRVVALQKLTEKQLEKKARQGIAQHAYENVIEICTVLLNKNDRSKVGWKYYGETMTALGRHEEARVCQERLRKLK